MLKHQQELAKRAATLAAETKPLSKVKKKPDAHMWFLSKDSGGGYLVTMGDPERPSSKIVQRFSGPSGKQELAHWVKYEMQDKVSQDHVFDATGLHLVPEFYTEWYVENMMKKTATSPEQWELAGDILDQGTGHPAFKALSTAWDKIVQELGEAKKRSEKMRKMGVGRTEDPTFILTMVVPAMETYGKVLDKVVQQLKQKLGG